ESYPRSHCSCRRQRKKGNPAIVTIIFETHATSVDNERRVASGHSDAELSMLGRRQAADLGARYAREGLHAIFCSDLQPSSRTSEIAFAARGLPLIRDVRLRECDYGEWT